jgi:hypothetical protein
MQKANLNIISKLLTHALIISLLILNLSCGEKKQNSSSSGKEVEIVFWHSFVSSTVPAVHGDMQCARARPVG